jgi:hypothetical protein
MLILKPKGRGNWATVDVVISGARALPLLFQPGQTITFGGIVWRICRVHA